MLETFFKHYLAPKLARNASEARGDLMYDEGELAFTGHAIES